MPVLADSPPSSPDSMTSESSISAFSEPSYSWMPSLISVPDPVVFDLSEENCSRSALQPRKPKRRQFDTTKSLSPAVLEHQRARELPLEVVECILHQLQLLHNSDQITFQHDLRCLALTNKYWSEAVAPRLHATIYFILTDLHSQRKWYGSRSKARLRSVQKLLRTHSQHVRTIVVPDGHVLSTTPTRTSADLADILAGLVEQCPNLERLVGVTVPHNHDRSRLSEALSSREHLQEHNWTIDRSSKSWKSKHVKPGTPSLEQTDRFMSLHSKWSRLQTLALRGTAETSERLCLDFLTSLPNLRHLCLSHFNAHSLTDSQLLSVPHQLESLRLESLPGLTQAGLSSFFSVTSLRKLRSLSLLDLDIHSLAFITQLFNSLPLLLRLALRTGHIDLDTPSAPALAHRTLTHLHWALASLEKTQQPLAANAILAAYITEDAFPALRHLHCPNDPAGLLQSVCRPLAPLRADQITRDQVNGVALAAYSRATQALGGTGSCWGGDVAKGGQGVVRFIVFDEDLQMQVRRLEVPRCLGRVEGIHVPVYELTPWMHSIDEAMVDTERGLQALF